MALRRTIYKHLTKDHQTTTTTFQYPPFNSLSSSHKVFDVAKSYFHRNPSPTAVGPGFFRRFLQRRKINQMSLPELFLLPVGETLREKLRISGGERLRLDGLRSPNPTVNSSEDSVGISVNDARKIMRFSQLQKVRSELKRIPRSSVSYSEFLTVCIDSCTNHEQGLEFSRMLDQAGDVIVLGNIVFLHPDQLAKSMEKLMLQSMAIPNDPRKPQLEELERQKALIDKKSLSQVRGELYCGLGFLMVQTLAFMRLTFWELSWDVMEPICFFVTSLHFALAYVFFIRTSKEPTFESYFQRRFRTKQMKLMKVHNFDLQKYDELRKVFYPISSDSFAVPTGYQDSGRGGSSNTVFG
ncbi:hypothetical protein OSB04_003382 [Centaurea solstitialis]|uniref:Calcium uniporter protein C-terminal domain-containing protein n=1 Tax=Centaurea solstitialis TaxID=347529 RepID=A0AA38U573_9ASTR|nr:hypothetical protein OSB04_003382 [Centaurea solstitialis]